ncbi:MAG: P1 family peptidase [Tissierellia bacterium]|nr:P1 family peptidase [Tissierellia bacterium]
MEWEVINITDIGGFRIGNAQDYKAMTGVTVIIFDKENTGGIHISGGGPASRETLLLSPYTNPKSLNAIVLSGGSAYGLEASSGVMKYLEEHKIGYQVANTIVPLVCQSCIFDLNIGSSLIRPDSQMGYTACKNAEYNQPKSGIVGAGTGATVGKINGMKQAQKSGLGYYALKVGNLKVGAIAVVNAVGDIFDYKTGQKVAGMLNQERTDFISSEREIYRMETALNDLGNTTLGLILTNASFSQSHMSKIAKMATSAYGRCINPVGTMADGDTIYAISVDGKVKADLNQVGTLASRVLSEAILKAISNSKMSDDEFLAKIIS